MTGVNLSKALDIAKTIAGSAPNVIKDIIERHFPFWNINRRALDIYISEIEKSDASKEVKAWQVLHAKQDFKKLANMKSVMEIAAEFLTEDDVKGVRYSDNEEWFDRFFERASSVSDEGVRKVWGRVLAEEIKNIGSTPRSILRILSEIDSATARSFTSLCRMRLVYVPIKSVDNDYRAYAEVAVYSDNDYYTSKDLGYSALSELETIGLIVSNPMGIYKEMIGVEKVLISDGFSTECLVMQTNSQLMCGIVSLTSAGRFLCHILNMDFYTDQMSVMKQYYKLHGYSFDVNDKRKIEIQGKTLKIVDISDGTILYEES